MSAELTPEERKEAAGSAMESLADRFAARFVERMSKKEES